jgi:hypothetical protein
MKKRHRNAKKARSTQIYVELREDAILNWNERDKALEFLNSKGEVSKKHLVSIGEGYERKGKALKILRQVVNRLGGAIKMGPEAIYFDRYIGIDTSYKVWGDNFICATACLTIDQTIDHEKGLNRGDTLEGVCLPRLIFWCKGGTNPERYGWKRFIETIVKADDFNPEYTYGIVVDSELGLLPKINAREEPVFEDYFLPSNVSLIYASADTGEDYFYNQLIRSTDRVASSALEKARQHFSGQESMNHEKTCQDLLGFAGPVNVTW